MLVHVNPLSNNSMISAQAIFKEKVWYMNSETSIWFLESGSFRKMQRAGRMKRELQILQTNPPHGISCWPKNDSVDQLEARMFFFLIGLHVH